MTTYSILKGIDKDLYREFKTACAYYGLSMRDVLITHMGNVVKDYRRARTEFEKPIIYQDKKGEK